MKSADTSLGGSAGEFPKTTLGLFSRLGDPGPGGRRAALDALCRRYWKPVYRYLRMARAKTNDDAKDLTQAFFLWLMEGDALARYEPERGSFRRFLKVVIGGFSGNEDRALATVKRGGGAAFVSLDGEGAALKEGLSDPAAVTPEQAFDLEWANSIVEQAVARVRRRFESGGRALQFRVYEEQQMTPGGATATQAELAARLGLKEADVWQALHAVREAIRSELRAELMETSSDERELEKEWNDLFSA